MDTVQKIAKLAKERQKEKKHPLRAGKAALQQGKLSLMRSESPQNAGRWTEIFPQGGERHTAAEEKKNNRKRDMAGCRASSIPGGKKYPFSHFGPRLTSHRGTDEKKNPEKIVNRDCRERKLWRGRRAEKWRRRPFFLWRMRKATGAPQGIHHTAAKGKERTCTAREKGGESCARRRRPSGGNRIREEDGVHQKAFLKSQLSGDGGIHS